MKYLLGLLLILLTKINAPAQPAGSHFDESKVPSFILPDALISHSGKTISTVEDWENIRRPEIINLFKTYVYGKEAIGKPANMTWSEIERVEADTSMALYKKVQILLDGKAFGPKITLEISLPKSTKPVPVFLFLSRSHQPELLLERGYGLVTFNPNEFEPDNKTSAFESGIRSHFISPDKTELADDDWGTLAAWAWGASRAMDYLQTDFEIASNMISILGFSRTGKAANWAGAKDERFAIVFSGEAGCGGATILRRGYGETVKAINNYAPHWFNANFKKYIDREENLPLDFHMLMSLVAPRPLYIATAVDDKWGDPHGSFLAGANAESVYHLYSKTGLGTSIMPDLEHPIGDWIGYHNRTGAHGVTAYDWTHWLNFADKHFGK